MLLNARRATKQFFVYGFGNMCQTALSFLLLPVYLRLFAPEEYGVISVLFVVVHFSSMVASAGMISALHRLYFTVDAEERRRLAGSCALWHLCLGVVVGAILAGFAEPVARALFGTAARTAETRLLGAYFLFNFALEVPFNLLRLEERSAAYVSFSLIRFGVDFVLKIIFVIVAGRGVVGYLESGLIAAALTLIASSITVRRLIARQINMVHVRQMLRLGIPFIFSGFAIWSLSATDRMFLNYLVGQSATGLYAVGQKFSQIFYVVLAAPFSLLLPAVVFRFAEEHDRNETGRMLARLMNVLVMLGGLVYLSIILGMRDLLYLFSQYLGVREEYVEAIPLIPVLTTVPFCYFLSTCAGYGLLLAKRPELTSLAAVIVAALNVALNMILIPPLGVFGAATATSISCIAYVMLNYYWAQRHYRVPYEWRGVFFSLAATLIIATGLWLLPIHNHVMGILVRAPGGVVLFAVVLWFSPRTLTGDLKTTVTERARALRARVARWSR